MIAGKVTVRINRNVSEELLRNLDRGLDDVADAILWRSQEMVPVDEATLKHSGHVERKFLDKKVIYDAPHAAFPEFGTRPHFPPVKPLIAWARRHGMDDPEAAGWQIARKIAAKGTEPQPYLRPAADFAFMSAEWMIRRRVHM